MGSFVQEKKFKRKRLVNPIGREISKKIKLIYPKLNISIKWVWIIIILAIFIYGIFFIIRNTILKPENYIQNISYGKSSVDTYDNPYLYQKIGELIRGENYYIVSKFKKDEILQSIQNEFPMVSDIKIIQPEKYGASVQIQFYEPEIVIRLGDRKFGVLGESDFEIFSGNSIGADTFYVELPQYTSGFDTLYGLFYENTKEKFISDMNVIAQAFPDYQRIVYLPGSNMTAIFFDGGKRIYINNQNSLERQISNYEKLINYYSGAKSLKIIDLGSLDENKIIVQ